MAQQQDTPQEKERIEEAEERQSPSSHVVHEAILGEGLEELERPNSALAWSGLAGGLSMGFSLIAEAMLRAALPDTPWRPLVAKLGYSVGFLIVILGRQQLFTENTLTPILPLLDRKAKVSVLNVLRLWLVVLLANLAGALAISLVLAHTGLLDESVRHAIADIGREALEPVFGLVFLRGIFAGWLIALIVWLLPYAESARIWVIVAITYVIGVAKFSHVIAGAIEVFSVAATGDATWSAALSQFVLPALLGNIIGGVALVAALNHAQVAAGK
jgi:formate/nitrite transporter FocA (FNT family)